MHGLPANPSRCGIYGDGERRATTARGGRGRGTGCLQEVALGPRTRATGLASLSRTKDDDFRSAVPLLCAGSDAMQVTMAQKRGTFQTAMLGQLMLRPCASDAVEFGALYIKISLTLIAEYVCDERRWTDDLRQVFREDRMLHLESQHVPQQAPTLPSRSAFLRHDRRPRRLSRFSAS